jgi:aspartyl-tRNA(Asn)/glutamyl-tRNA(Gln) amidotransferase subunit C
MPVAPTDAEIAELATLARLALSADEARALRVDLAAILDHVAALTEVDTTGVEPMTHAMPTPVDLGRAEADADAHAGTRADEAAPSLPVAVALAGASVVRDDHFVVPTAISGDGASGGAEP